LLDLAQHQDAAVRRQRPASNLATIKLPPTGDRPGSSSIRLSWRVCTNLR
jgi:hypothetical protein